MARLKGGCPAVGLPAGQSLAETPHGWADCFLAASLTERLRGNSGAAQFAVPSTHQSLLGCGGGDPGLLPPDGGVGPLHLDSLLPSLRRG